jgi:hypothetical protein
VEISASDFVGEPSAGAVSGVASSGDGAVAASVDDAARAVEIEGDGGAVGGAPDLIAGDAELDAIVRSARAGSGMMFIDAKIGDISGKPIYVSSFFAPIEERLVALAQTNTSQAWQREMQGIVKQRLDDIVFDELLRAETLATLTPEQRTGIQAFMEQFRESLLSEHGGSARYADRRIQEQQGISLDDAVRQKELDTLVGLTLQTEINDRVNVTWRDIKNRYERDYERFNPPATVRVRVIRVLEGEGALVDSVTARLEAGESFESIARSDVNTFNRDTGGELERVVDGSFGETSFIAYNEVNEAIWGMGEDAEPGTWVGPVGVGGTQTYWVEYVGSAAESRSLYEAQLTIFKEITQERLAEERSSYLETLMKRARVSSYNEVLARLFYLAYHLYGPGA